MLQDSDCFKREGVKFRGTYSAEGYGDGRALDINGLVALTWLMISVTSLVASERFAHRI